MSSRDWIKNRTPSAPPAHPSRRAVRPADFLAVPWLLQAGRLAEALAAAERRR
ncbi:MAG: hypothetical protein ACRDRO_11960 [Pseudonocardiaceae bacterium]